MLLNSILQYRDRILATLFVAQILMGGQPCLHATNFFEETCSWHQEHYADAEAGNE